MPSIDALADRLSAYLGPDQVNLVRRAYFYAEQAHDGQRRRSGEAYVTHPLAVANILADMHMDHQSLMAAMLHDVIEDTGIAKEALSAQFGETVAELVDGVSKLTQMNFETKAEAQAENFQKMAMAMARDIRVILVKLADRLHNMRTLEVLSGEKRRRIAKETLEIYAPIANRLGMHAIRIEFEDLGFKAMHPMRSARIYQAVKRARGNRKEIVNKIEESLSHCLAIDEIEGEVSGRQKHIYGIYKKMRGKRRAFNEIMDVYAFRIIVDKVDTCYRVLGAVHNLYKPCRAASRTTSRFPRPTAISRCIPRCLVCTGCRSRSRSAPGKWKKWPTTASPPIGCTSPVATSSQKAPMPARASG